MPFCIDTVRRICRWWPKSWRQRIHSTPPKIPPQCLQSHQMLLASWNIIAPNRPCAVHVLVENASLLSNRMSTLWPKVHGAQGNGCPQTLRLLPSLFDCTVYVWRALSDAFHLSFPLTVLFVLVLSFLPEERAAAAFYFEGCKNEGAEWIACTLSSFHFCVHLAARNVLSFAGILFCVFM